MLHESPIGRIPQKILMSASVALITNESFELFEMCIKGIVPSLIASERSHPKRKHQGFKRAFSSDTEEVACHISSMGILKQFRRSQMAMRGGLHVRRICCSHDFQLPRQLLMSDQITVCESSVLSLLSSREKLLLCPRRFLLGAASIGRPGSRASHSQRKETA